MDINKISPILTVYSNDNHVLLIGIFLLIGVLFLSRVRAIRHQRDQHETSEKHTYKFSNFTHNFESLKTYESQR